MWPSLLKDDFMTSMITPVVKVTKGKSKVSFYNLSHYLEGKRKITTMVKVGVLNIIKEGHKHNKKKSKSILKNCV